MLSSLSFRYNYAYPFDSISLVIRSHSHPSFILEPLLLIPLMLSSILRFHCSYPRPTLNIFPPSQLYLATQLPYPQCTYALSFPFLSFSFPSHSMWLYHYIFILALTHHLFILHLMACIVLLSSSIVWVFLLFLWLIARLSLLYDWTV